MKEAGGPFPWGVPFVGIIIGCLFLFLFALQRPDSDWTDDLFFLSVCLFFFGRRPHTNAIKKQRGKGSRNRAALVVVLYVWF